MINSIKNSLNYFYYCMRVIYYKNDRMGDTANHAISMLIFSILFTILNLLRILLFGHSKIIENENLRVLVIICFLGIYFLIKSKVALKYKNFKIIDNDIWGSISRRKIKLHGILFIFFVFLVFILPTFILYGNVMPWNRH